jgi:hypothetical protein
MLAGFYAALMTMCSPLSRIHMDGRAYLRHRDCLRLPSEGVMHIDLILMIVLAALAVWTEVDKLTKRRRQPQLTQ